MSSVSRKSSGGGGGGSKRDKKDKKSYQGESASSSSSSSSSSKGKLRKRDKGKGNDTTTAGDEVSEQQERPTSISEAWFEDNWRPTEDGRVENGEGYTIGYLDAEGKIVMTPEGKSLCKYNSKTGKLSAIREYPQSEAEAQGYNADGYQKWI